MHAMNVFLVKQNVHPILNQTMRTRIRPHTGYLKSTMPLSHLSNVSTWSLPESD